ncbi:MAG: alpha-amylase family glycosyl hydrolase [Paludibacter sp.]|nr:alpha-amylase family glycosyl hydrolase [Paludibacter sp.]
MKKSILLFLSGVLSFAVTAQIIVTNPAFVTRDYAGVIEVIYDASLGQTALKDYTGADGIYAHTGVITTASLTDTDWKHAPTWGDNAAKYKLTSLGNNKWRLMITPDMAAYYGLTSGEVVTKLAFVFRNGTPTGTTYKEGKDTGGKDIFVPVYEAGLNVAFSSPTSNQSVAVGALVNFSVVSSITADLSLQVDGATVKTASAATTLTHTQTFSTAKDYVVIASATTGGITVYDTILVNVPSPVTNEARPAGVKNGINYNSNTSVTLVLHAPNKNNVFLIGDMNDWSKLNAYQLKKDGEYWWITLNDLTPGRLYGFQYLVDGTIRVSDPYTELVLDPYSDAWINEYHNRFPDLKPYPTGKTDGLVATFQTAKTQYNWEVPNFVMPPRENMVIYELLLRDFTTEKSLEAAIQKLDYLKTLGVTAIELMPIHEFDGNESWGYNPNHFFAPDKAYGTPEMYKRFVDECHKRGMAVIIDVVFNHATGNNPMAALYWSTSTNKTTSDNPWYNVNAPHPYSVFHDFNHEYQGTRDYFKRVLQYWIQEYKIDGYRLDLTKGFTQNVSSESTASNKDDSRINILTDYYNAAKSVKEDVMFILEHFCNYDEELELANRGMYLWRKVNNAFSQAAMGFQSDSDFGGLNSLPRRWVGYAESHDEERNFYKAKTWGTGTVKTDSVYRITHRVPLNIAFATLVPGPKMLWQFQEIGFDYSIDAFGGRTNNKPPVWDWLNLPHRKAAYDTSAKIITLRRMFPDAFTQGNFSLQIGSGDWESGRRIALTHGDLNLVVLGNFKADASITASPNFSKTGMWYNVLTGEPVNVTNTSMTVTVPKGQVLLFADRVITFPSGIDNPSEDTNSNFLYPTVTSDRVYVTTNTYQHNIQVFNTQGQLLNTIVNEKEIDLSAYASGVYFIRLNSDKGTVTGKVVRR